MASRLRKEANGAQDRGSRALNSGVAAWSGLGFGRETHLRGAKPLTELPREGLSLSRRRSAVRTHAGTSESGLIGGFLGGVFGRHLIGWLTKHAYDNGSKQCADNSMNAVCA